MSTRNSMSEATENNSTEKGVSFTVAGKKLKGLIVEASNSDFSTLLIGGGGHIPHREYYGAWQSQLADMGMSSMSFDFRGVGASEGELDETGLQTRLEDARGATQYLKELYPNRRLCIMGVSMGGAVAIQLANEIHAESLVLIAPAAYAEEARHVSFGPAFTAILRKEGSWHYSPEFSQLEDFKGKILLAYGKEDEVIPEPILTRYGKVVRKNGGSVLAIPRVDHGLMRRNDSDSIAARKKIKTALETIYVI